MSQDLFNDTTMTFGEHLEVLRTHLLRALAGLAISVLLSLTFSQHVIRFIQVPVTTAMQKHFGVEASDAAVVSSASSSFWNRVASWFGSAESPITGPSATPPDPVGPAPNTTATGHAPPSTHTNAASSPKGPTIPGQVEPPPIRVQLDARELATQLHNFAPKVYPPPPEGTEPAYITVNLTGGELQQFRRELKEELFRDTVLPRTDTPDEAFMIYTKVSIVTGVVVASPWIFYQIWLFVAAGLYPHERKYVYTYLPLSVGLFLGGAMFCFFVVIPFVLDFLFQFNSWLNLRPEMRINSWISFALTMSLMFGLSFQLPLVMLFLERISVFRARDYREKRRVAILVISILSMVLTPNDLVSMFAMMVPLCILYEFGILLCKNAERKSPFEMQPA